MRTVIIILGPTASGKTDAAVALARKINGEIISADSRQIYKHMDIGTNKPPAKQLRAVPHHLINIASPTGTFSAGEFATLANKQIKDIFGRNRIPIIAGGTGFYTKALTDGLVNAPSDKILRTNLRKELEKKGLNSLYGKLAKLDPQTAKTIDKKNPVRIIRALELCLLTGKRFSRLKKTTKKSAYNFLIFGLSVNKNELYKRIDARVDKMVKNGLFEEVRKLIKKYSAENIVLKNTIGYREIIAFLSGELSRAAAIDLIKKNTRHYAKRQMTWFNKISGIIWMDSKNNTASVMLNYIKKSGII